MEASEVDSDEDFGEEEETLEIIRRLKAHVDEIFPNGGDDPEPTILFHDDLSKHNILVTDSGSLTGVVDWECVSAKPIWKACDLPAFLQSLPRYKEPDLSSYTHNSTGEVDESYWRASMQYEVTQLSRHFIDEMRRMEPQWVQIYESKQKQRDFAFAMLNCDDFFV